MKKKLVFALSVAIFTSEIFIIELKLTFAMMDYSLTTKSAILDNHF